jgi:hypothetical protein
MAGVYAGARRSAAELEAPVLIPPLAESPPVGSIGPSQPVASAGALRELFTQARRR